MHKGLFLLAVISIALGLIFIVYASTAHASFAEDYQTYLGTYDNYRRAYDLYVVTRNQYLTFATLNAKTAALISVKNFLTVRDDVLLAYIGLLRQKNTDDIFNQLLDDQQTFLNGNKAKISTIVSLDDAVGISRELENKHLEMQITAHKALGAILAHKVEVLSSQFTQALGDAQTILSDLRAAGKNTETLDRWLMDAKSKQNLAVQKLDQIHTQLLNLNSSSIDSANENFTALKFSLFEANQYVHEATNFLTEYKERIKYGNY